MNLSRIGEHKEYTKDNQYTHRLEKLRGALLCNG